MSWSFEFVAANKAAAAEELEAQSGHMPASLQGVLIDSINEQRDDVAILVKTQGHIGGAYAHNATFEVRGVKLIAETTTA